MQQGIDEMHPRLAWPCLCFSLSSGPAACTYDSDRRKVAGTDGPKYVTVFFTNERQCCSNTGHWTPMKRADEYPGDTLEMCPPRAPPKDCPGESVRNSRMWGICSTSTVLNANNESLHPGFLLLWLIRVLPSRSSPYFFAVMNHFSLSGHVFPTRLRT